MRWLNQMGFYEEKTQSLASRKLCQVHLNEREKCANLPEWRAPC